MPRAIQLNQYGGIPKGVIAQLIAVARKEGHMKKTTSKRVKVSGKLDLFYGIPTGTGKPMPRGIYKIVINGSRESLIPLIVFPTTAVTYKKKLDFQGIAKRIAEREWPQQFASAFDDAMRTAR